MTEFDPKPTYQELFPENRTDTHRSASDDARAPDTSSDASTNASSVTSSVTSPAEGPPTAQAILDACRGRFVTARRIAETIGRSPVTVRDEIPRLVNTGLLERRFPDSQRHPRQAYRTVERAGPEGSR